MTWASFLLGLAGPLALRALTYVGFGFVAFTAVEIAFRALIVTAQGYWSGLPAAVLQIAGLAGVPQCLGIIVGAQLARVLLWMKAKSVQMLLKK